MGTNQRPLPPSVPQSQAPLGPPPSNEIDTEQLSITRFNREVIAGLLSRSGPQKAPLTANAMEFQPSPSEIVGDVVTGMPRDAFPREEHLESVLGGRSILVAGADSAALPAPPEHPSLVDYPDGKGRYGVDQHGGTSANAPNP